MKPSSFVAAALVLALTSCSAPALQLESSDISDGQPMPRVNYYTRCGGANVAPALAWSGAPIGTSTYAITMIDRSVQPAGWSHWIAINIPESVHALPRGGMLPPVASGVQSNFGDATYAGPCPPAGTGVHRYEITLYALPGPAPSLAPNADATQIAQTLSADALAKATLSVTAETPAT